ncbi:MAG TPA: hypothetical protein ENG74_00115 [Thermoplasmatales archaeon]|nr:hypothetical protein [Thermoplasmatales archaeon]
MDTAKTIQILKATVGNPITRKILSSLGYCDECKANRLEVALELYVGLRKEKDACIKCVAAEKLLSTCGISHMPVTLSVNTATRMQVRNRKMS